MTTGRRGPGKDTEADAERRRHALKKALDSHHLTPADASRAAGLVSPNSIYNFLSGRSNSLSQQTMEALARVIPDASIEELAGFRSKVVEPKTVLVKTAAVAGLFRDTFERPLRAQEEILLPIPSVMIEAGAYAIAVEEPGAERLYAKGSILAVMPLGTSYAPELRTGLRVILQRMRNGKIEVTVREVEISGTKSWLWIRSTDPEHQQPIPGPVPLNETMWRHKDERFTIRGLVLGAWTPEIATMWQKAP